MKNILLFLFFGIIILSSCKKEGCFGSVKAELKDYTGLDGCGMLIKLNDGSILEPTNLTDFNISLEDGKKIWINYDENNGASICMVGKMIEINCISDR